MQGAENKLTFRKLAVFTAIMFAFGFALVPIYEKICEVTGVRDLLRPDQVKNTQVDTSRTIKVEFDSNSPHSPWLFKPEMSTINVHPGELTTVVYEITNQTPKAMTGQAIPSYGPTEAGMHFKKLECFCFAKQEFQANEKRQFPVVFVIDPKLPKDVNTITLSYTLFEMPGGVAPPVNSMPKGKLESASYSISDTNADSKATNPTQAKTL
jgi:cytochrome c oxidase assembly protein subunit 11